MRANSFLMPAFIAALAVFVLASCGKIFSEDKKENSYSVKQSKSNDEFISMGAGFVLDSSLGDSEKGIIKSDLNRVTKFDLQGLSDNGVFASTFGGTKTTDLVEYLGQRIRVFFAENLEIEDRLALAHLNEKFKGVTMASNYSPILWLVVEAQRIKGAFINGKNYRLPIKDCRVGAVKIGEGYMMQSRFESIDRIETLVHEARHSDCTGGIPRSNLNQIRDDADKGFDIWKNSSQCGHPHSKCPAGHEFAGLAACDNHAWGPYSFGAIFESTIGQYCINCTEREKQRALIASQDSFQRIVLGGTLKWEQRVALDEVTKMLTGSYGKPNTGNYGVLENQ